MYALMNSMIQAIFGAGLGACANDAWGRRKVILVSTLLFTICSIVLGAARTFEELICGRFGIGIGIGLSSMTGT